MAEKPQLLPIGTRVTHFDGNPEYTHGSGTIIAYNGVEPSQYLEKNFKEAVTMAAEAGLLGAIPSMIYDKVRCPYVVHFDIHPHKKGQVSQGIQGCLRDRQRAACDDHRENLRNHFRQ